MTHKFAERRTDEIMHWCLISSLRICTRSEFVFCTDRMSTHRTVGLSLPSKLSPKSQLFLDRTIGKTEQERILGWIMPNLHPTGYHNLSLRCQSIVVLQTLEQPPPSATEKRLHRLNDTLHTQILLALSGSKRSSGRPGLGFASPVSLRQNQASFFH